MPIASICLFCCFIICLCWELDWKQKRSNFARQAIASALEWIGWDMTADGVGRWIVGAFSCEVEH